MVVGVFLVYFCDTFSEGQQIFYLPILVLFLGTKKERGIETFQAYLLSGKRPDPSSPEYNIYSFPIAKLNERLSEIKFCRRVPFLPSYVPPAFGCRCARKKTACNNCSCLERFQRFISGPSQNDESCPPAKHKMSLCKVFCKCCTSRADDSSPSGVSVQESCDVSVAPADNQSEVADGVQTAETSLSMESEA